MRLKEIIDEIKKEHPNPGLKPEDENLPELTQDQQELIVKELIKQIQESKEK